jgi:hypothetical protein
MDEHTMRKELAATHLLQRSSFSEDHQNTTTHTNFGSNSRCSGLFLVSLLYSITQHVCCESYIRSYPLALQNTTNHRCILRYTSNGDWQMHSSTQRGSDPSEFGIDGLVELRCGTL